MSADTRGSQSESWPPDDPLLDACLSEVLGGPSPPDLTARILAAWEQKRAATNGVPSPYPHATMAPHNEEQGWTPVGANGYYSPSNPDSLRTANRPIPVPPPLHNSGGTTWINAAIAACLILAISVAGTLVYRTIGDHRAAPPIAKTTAESRDADALRPQPQAVNPDSQVGSDSEKAPDAPPVVSSDPGAVSESPLEEESPVRGFDETPPFAASQSNQEATPVVEPGYARSKPAPDYEPEILATIARRLQESWQAAGVTPSPLATDGEWARRTYLRILGRIPTYNELIEFQRSPSTTRKEELVNRLLFDDEYVEQYARHWSSVWTNLLIGRTGGTDKDDLANREGLEQYLRRSFQFNRPYDQVVFELVAATGSNRPGTDEYNGAVNFILGNYTHNFTLATSKTAQVFLGKRLHCVQCHNHPFESWTQDDYWGLNAFFRQAAVVRDADQVRLVNRDFPGETGDISKAEIFYDRLNGVRKVVYPTFLDGATINPDGHVANVDRRRELANLLTESRELSRALVNRLWGHFLGYGFVTPIDDVRPNNPASHPELLDYLADQFIAHGYDMKRLVRWIALSDAFARSSRITPGNLVDVPENGVPPLFSRYYTRQMSAEEIYDSLALLAANGDRSSDVFAQLQAGRTAWLSQFTFDMQTDEGDETTTFNGTIPQSLAMMNGEIVQATMDSPHGFLSTVARSNLKPNEKLDRIFLATVARKPLPREVDAANRLLVTHQGDLHAALQDLWWALLNSNEFILDH